MPGSVPLFTHDSIIAALLKDEPTPTTSPVLLAQEDTRACKPRPLLSHSPGYCPCATPRARNVRRGGALSECLYAVLRKRSV